MAETAGIAEERWESLLDTIELGKVVPIVGRRLSLVDVDGGKPMPLQKAAAERMAHDLGVDPLPAGWGLAELHRAMAEKDTFDLDAFHPKLKRMVAGMTPYLQPLRQLAEISHFRLFLSTSFDGFLEQAVREVRGSGESVCAYTFAPGYENPQRPIARAGEVCVYHLLGSRDTCPNWAVTAEELVEFVLGLLSEKYRPEQLFAALKDKHLLAIGCQIPDWLGRFFLRALRNGPISEQKGSNVLVEDALEADAAFGRYLQMFGKKALVVPGDAVGFVDELHRRWKARVGDAAPANPAGAGARPVAVAAAAETAASERPAKVFLSYAHDDGAMAQQLYDYLRGQGIDVWKDDRYDALAKGANWDHEIRRQIADCACFVAVISRHTTDTSESYFWKEWNLALQRSQQMDSLRRRFIFPVLGDRGVDLPEQFKDSQWTLLSDDDDRAALARSLREEQRRLRKEAR
jgi:TIR domain/SIR2-like domain